VRKLLWIVLSLGLCGCFIAARADTFGLTDGGSISGDIVMFNDGGVTLRTITDSYTNVVWPKFSQDALKQLAKNPKARGFVEAFIEPPPKPKAGDIQVHDVSRLELPRRESLFAALLSSSVGFVVLLLIYAANIYAGYEIAIVRARPIGLAMGVSAVLPILGPIIFLSMPIRKEAPPEEAQPQAEAQSYSVPGAAAPMAEGVATGGIHASPAGAKKAGHPEAQIFQRGQYMFNRRFFETKFSGFFSVVRRPAEKDLVLVIKTGRAQLIAQRITRIAANEAHFEVIQGGGRQELMVPFADIQEIQLKHKDG
jgi:hypothetical protein